MTATCFDVQSFVAEPHRLPGVEATPFDHYEWLQLAIGRFLTPARVANGRVEYFLSGEEPTDATEAAETLGHELPALAAAFHRLRSHFSAEIEAQRAQDIVLLASLVMLLELHLPLPGDTKAVHLRGGVLVLSGWGLADGVRVGDLLASSDGSKSESYLTALQKTLESKYDCVSSPAAALANDAPSSRIPAEDRRRRRADPTPMVATTSPAAARKGKPFYSALYPLLIIVMAGALFWGGTRIGARNERRVSQPVLQELKVVLTSLEGQLRGVNKENEKLRTEAQSLNGKLQQSERNTVSIQHDLASSRDRINALERDLSQLKDVYGKLKMHNYYLYYLVIRRYVHHVLAKTLHVLAEIPR